VAERGKQGHLGAKSYARLHLTVIILQDSLICVTSKSAHPALKRVTNPSRDVHTTVQLLAIVQ
jgi:hypothetical protein